MDDDNGFNLNLHFQFITLFIVCSEMKGKSNKLDKKKGGKEKKTIKSNVKLIPDTTYLTQSI